jgi:hypothetical protein
MEGLGALVVLMVAKRARFGAEKTSRVTDIFVATGATVCADRERIRSVVIGAELLPAIMRFSSAIAASAPFSRCAY